MSTVAVGAGSGHGARERGRRSRAADDGIAQTAPGEQLQPLRAPRPVSKTGGGAQPFGGKPPAWMEVARIHGGPECRRRRDVEQPHHPRPDDVERPSGERGRERLAVARRHGQIVPREVERKGAAQRFYDARERLDERTIRKRKRCRQHERIGEVRARHAEVFGHAARIERRRTPRRAMHVPPGKTLVAREAWRRGDERRRALPSNARKARRRGRPAADRNDGTGGLVAENERCPFCGRTTASSHRCTTPLAPLAPIKTSPGSSSGNARSSMRISSTSYMTAARIVRGNTSLAIAGRAFNAPLRSARAARPSARDEIDTSPRNGKSSKTTTLNESPIMAAVIPVISSC